MANTGEGLIDLCAEFSVKRLLAALLEPENAAVQAEIKSRVWEGEVPSKLPDGAPYNDFYPCILVVWIKPIFDLYAITDETPEANVIGSNQFEMKVVGQNSGFPALRPIKRFIYITMQGSDGVLDGGSIGSCTITPTFAEIRNIEPAEGGTKYFNSGWNFNITAQRETDD